ncbi:MAG: TRAM domain-containing protein [archaeon]
MYGERFQKFSPVKVGDEIDVKIEAIGEKGDGIAKKDGFVLVIPNTHKDDEVRVRVTKVLRRVGFAEVVGKGEAKEESNSEEVEDAEEESEEESSEELGGSEDEESEEFDEDSEDLGEDTENF